MENSYTLEPSYNFHDYTEDVVNVLACQIKVWKATAPNWFDDPGQYTVITEVENIEILESYQELITGAVIHLPKGAIIEDTIITKAVDNEITTGNGTEAVEETKLSEASRYGELLTVDDSVSKDDNMTLSVDESRPDGGFNEISESQKKHLASSNDFAVGNRIEIWLGYLVESGDLKEDISDKFQKLKQGEKLSELYLAFTGFITGCSVSTPLEIECENMASLLKKKGSAKGMFGNKCTISDFLSDSGKYKLLKNTGISLAPWVQPIKLGAFEINDNLSVYSLLYSWKQKNGIYSMLERDGKTLRVGMLHIEKDQWPSDKNTVNYKEQQSVQYLQHDWDIVNDGLKVTNVEKEYIVINAKAHQEKTKTFRVMVGKVDGKFHHEKHDYLIRKKQKRKKGQKNRPAVISKFDSTKYMVITRDFGQQADMNELIKNAEKYWTAYNPNGISGELVVYGNLRIAPTDIIGFISPLYPEKNGHYVVESVRTTFGVNGFRQTLTIPYKLSSFTKPVKIVRE